MQNTDRILSGRMLALSAICLLLCLLLALSLWRRQAEPVPIGAIRVWEGAAGDAA